MKVMIKLKNKSKRLKEELDKLSEKNKHLNRLIYDLALFVEDVYWKDIVITHIYRTQKQQDRFYKDNERYKKKKFKSPHQFWHAIDIRSNTFKPKEIKQIENYLNKKYNDTNYYKWTAKCHNVGKGEHFHIQLYVVE